MTKIVLGAVLLPLLLQLATGQDETEAQLEERLAKITERLVSYQRCRTDADCAENSFCYDNDNFRIGLCKCQQGFEMLERNRTSYSCRKQAIYNEPCEIDEQCVDNLGSLAKCNGVCGCSEDSSRSGQDGRCHHSVLLEDFCRTDANCLLEDGTTAYCTDGRCLCNIGLRPSADRKRCVEARQLGQTCANDYQCSFVENALCREVCRCGLGYAVSSNQSSCLKAATYFGEQCIEDDQCSLFLQESVCSGGNCTCADGHHGYENKCVRSAAIGDACRSVEECLPNDNYRDIADCVEGVCQCLPGAVDLDGRLACGSAVFTLSRQFLMFVVGAFVVNLL